MILMAERLAVVTGGRQGWALFGAHPKGLSLMAARHGGTLRARIDQPPGCRMRDNDLFQLALGISSPWFVASSDFDAANKRLDIKLDFKAGARFDCPECKAAGCPVHDTTEKTWRHLDFFSTRRS